MTTSQTIDLTKYIQQTVTGNDKTGNSKSYVDKSNTFGNILDNVNKSYSTDNSVSQNNNKQKTKSSVTKKAENKTTDDNENVSSKKFSEDNNSKVENKTSNQNEYSSNKEQTNSSSDYDNSNSNATSDKSTNNSNTTENNNTSDLNKENVETSNQNSTESNTTTEAPADTDSKGEQTASIAVKTEEAQNQNATEQAPIIVQQLENIPIVTKNIDTELKAVTQDIVKQATADVNASDDKTKQTEATPKADAKADTNTNINTNEQISININAGLENILSAITQMPAVQNNAANTDNTSTTIDSNNQANIIVAQDGTQNLNGNLTKIVNNLTKNNTSNQLEQSVSKVSTSVQQGVNTLPDASQNNQQQTLTDINVNNESNSPVIEVNTAADITTSTPEVDIANTKNESDTVANKASITQDLLDKTNAKITNIEKSSFSNSNQNNSFTGGNDAQEQIVKLQLENNTNTSTTIDAVQNIDLSINANLSQNANLSANVGINQQQNFSNITSNAQGSTQTSNEISKNEIISQINNQINTKNIQAEGTTKINIILKPENLGRINLELVNSKEGLKAQITTNNSQVKEILDKNIESLKDTLNAQGISVNNVSVKVSETQKQSNQDMASFENQMNQNNQQSSDNTKNKNSEEFLNEKTGNASANLSDAESAESTESTVETVTNNNMVESTTTIKGLKGKVAYKV